MSQNVEEGLGPPTPSSLLHDKLRTKILELPESTIWEFPREKEIVRDIITFGHK